MMYQMWKSVSTAYVSQICNQYCFTVLEVTAHELIGGAASRHTTTWSAVAGFHSGADTTKWGKKEA